MTTTMTTKTDARYFTVATVATYLGRTPKAIYRLLDRGEIPHIRIGRRVQFDRERIDRWMERHSKRGALVA